MAAGILKGSKNEIQSCILPNSSEKFIEKKRDEILHPRYIVYDIETDTSSGIHVPNLINVDVLKVHDTHEYEKSLLYKKSFEGYNCTVDFCQWLFNDENTHSTIIAHNGAGYDHKFILKWCLDRNFKPNNYIVQTSRISLMTFKKYDLRFTNSYYFFLSRLKDLSST